MRYTIAREEEVKKLASEGKDIEYISSVTGIPKKVIWGWCPELRPHDDIIRQSVKQRYHFIFPDYEARISSAFSPFVRPDISEDDWENLQKVIYSVLYEESLYVFKNAISEPPQFGEIGKLSDKKFIDYLKLFWNWETSEYVKNKNTDEVKIHKEYVDSCKNSIHFWSIFKNKLLRDITKGDIQIMYEKLSAKGLSQSRINGILKVGLIPLKYAYKKGETLLKAFDYQLPKISRLGMPLETDLIAKIFNADWDDQESYCANLIAYYCKLRKCEVRALTYNDIYTDGIIVTNNIYIKDKLEPNPHKQILKVNTVLIDILLRYSSMNPYKDHKPTDFVFFSIDRNKPSNCTNWNKSLNQIASQFTEQKLSFHIWSGLED